MFLERDGFVVEPRGRVVGRVLAAGHRDPSEVLGGGAVEVHVATRHHGDPRSRGELPEWRGPRELRALGGGGQG